MCRACLSWTTGPYQQLQLLVCGRVLRSAVPDQCCEQHDHGKQHCHEQLEQQQVDIVHCNQDFDECDSYDQLDVDGRLDSDKQQGGQLNKRCLVNDKHSWWMFGITVSEWRDVH